jgi:hypothetical protein
MDNRAMPTKGEISIKNPQNRVQDSASMTARSGPMAQGATFFRAGTTADGSIFYFYKVAGNPLIASAGRAPFRLNAAEARGA